MELFLQGLTFPIIDVLTHLAIFCQIASVLLLAAHLRRSSNKATDLVANNGVTMMLIVATVASLGSLFFSEIAYFAPCKLCWFQRIFMYPQVVLLGYALWKGKREILPFVLFLSLVGLAISIVHYSEQVLAILNPAAFDPSVPCDMSGISCKTTYIREYGYITIPMLALTAFFANVMIAFTAMRHGSADSAPGWKKEVGAIVLVLFLVAIGGSVVHTQGGGGHAKPSTMATKMKKDEPLVLTPKAELEVIDAKEAGLWAHVPTMPAPITREEQKMVVVKWEATELVGDLDPDNGVQYEFWGFEGSAPGPTLRVKQGDMVELHLTNNIESNHPHNIDFHFSTGPGGGAKALSVAPGETAVVHLRALYPGAFMYHCATPDIPTHIANGMYGTVVVDPASGPLPPVDHEFSIIQSEFYTAGTDAGVQPLDVEALDAENPNYVVFNGKVGSLLGENAPKVKVGDTVRLYVMNAGPQLITSFHVIGEIFDNVYREADFISPPGRGIQSTLIPAGGAAAVDFKIDVPGTYILVDHALARAIHKGAIGTIVAEGPDNFEIFQAFSDKDVPDGHMSGGHEPEEITGEEVIINILEGSGIRDSDPDNDYDPKELTIKAGTTVTWVNQDRMVHTATALDDSWDSGNLTRGQKWSYTFTEPGEYEYDCTPHPWMLGKIIVE